MFVKVCKLLFYSRTVREEREKSVQSRVGESVDAQLVVE